MQTSYRLHLLGADYYLDRLTKRFPTPGLFSPLLDSHSFRSPGFPDSAAAVLRVGPSTKARRFHS